MVDWTLPVAAALGLASLISIVLSALTLYTPVLNRALGDWTGIPLRPWSRLLLHPKIVSDNLAALSNVLLASPARIGVDDRVPAVHLLLGQDASSRLNHDILLYDLGLLPHKPEVYGTLERESGSPVSVRVSYAGTNNWHHQAWKPSLRLHLPKTGLVEGYRDHILTAPEDATGLRNWLSVELSRRWGLLTVGEHFVRLFVNRRYFGLYTRQWRLDDLLVARAGHAGGVFRLEDGTGPMIRRRSASFADARTWEIQVDGSPEDARADLQLLIDTALQAPSPARQERLNELVDRRAFARLLAVLCHAGSTHMSSHNLALWLDPVVGRFAPIVVDANGYDMYHERGTKLRPVLHYANPLTKAWLEDPRNLALYVSELDALLSGFGSPENTTDIVRRKWSEVRADALADLYAGDMGARDMSVSRSLISVLSLDGDVADLIRNIDESAVWIRAQLDLAAVEVVSRSSGGFEVLVRGLQGARAERKSGGGASRLLLTSMGGPPGRGWSTAYAFHRLAGRPEDYRFTARLTGRPVPLGAISGPDAARLRRDAGMHPDLIPPPPRDPVVLGPGRVVLSATRIFEPGRPVTVRAGTTLLLAPRVDLLTRGPLRIEGTAQNPVRIRPLDPDRPFGVVAAWGPEAGEAAIRHLDMEGGSESRRYAQRFPGMLSLSGLDRVSIRESRFGPNAAGRGAVHIAASSASVSGTVFESSASGGMRWQSSRGTVSGCLFRKNGGDGFGLDFGGAAIEGARFEDCGGPCIRVGKGAAAVVRASRVTRAERGVAVEDAGRVALSGVRFEGCRVVLDAAMKDWRWERRGEVSKALFRESQGRPAWVH